MVVRLCVLIRFLSCTTFCLSQTSHTLKHSIKCKHPINQSSFHQYLHIHPSTIKSTINMYQQSPQQQYILVSRSDCCHSTIICRPSWPRYILRFVPWPWRVMPRRPLRIRDPFPSQRFPWMSTLRPPMPCAVDVNPTSHRERITVGSAIGASVEWIVRILVVYLLILFDVVVGTFLASRLT